MGDRIYIKLLKGISPLGTTPEEVQSSYFEKPGHCLSISKAQVYSGLLKGKVSEVFESFCAEKGLHSDKYSRESRLLAFIFEQAEMDFSPQEQVALNVATSRGSLDFLAGIVSEYKENPPAYTSPYSTMGFLSSWPNVLSRKADLNFMTSSTCSSFGAVLMNGLAWLKSGMADHFLAAAVESPVSDFTIRQMKAINLYTSHRAEEVYPCRGGDLNKRRNTMVLGEAAYLFQLSRGESNVEIRSMGISMERPDNPASVDREGTGLQNAVHRSLDGFNGGLIDLIIGHLPGTLKGDQAEMNAYKAVFKENIPPVIGNKWKVGHSLGASLASSVEMAMLIFDKQSLPPLPGFLGIDTSGVKKIDSILITALGFGGQSVSLILSRNREGVANIVD